MLVYLHTRFFLKCGVSELGKRRPSCMFCISCSAGYSVHTCCMPRGLVHACWSVRFLLFNKCRHVQLCSCSCHHHCIRFNTDCWVTTHQVLCGFASYIRVLCHLTLFFLLWDRWERFNEWSILLQVYNVLLILVLLVMQLYCISSCPLRMVQLHWATFSKAGCTFHSRSASRHEWKVCLNWQVCGMNLLAHLTWYYLL